MPSSFLSVFPLLARDGSKGWMGWIDEALPAASGRFSDLKDLLFLSPLFCAQVSTGQAGSPTLFGISHY